MEKFITILKQMIKFVFLGTKSIIMRTINYYYFSIFIILLFLIIQPVNAQCEWLYENRDSELSIDTDGDGILNIDDSDIDDDGTPNNEDDDIDGDGVLNDNDMFPEGLQSYIIEDDGTIVLFYCDNMLDTLYAPVGYDAVVWQYIVILDTDGDGLLNDNDDDIDGDGIPNEGWNGTDFSGDSDIDGDGEDNGKDITPNGNHLCEDWDWIGDTYFLSIDSNDPCLEDLVGNRITISFIGQTGTQTDICEFDIEFFESPDPVMDIQGYTNGNESVTICEETVMNGFILTATGMGSNPNSEYIEYQWYLGGELLEGETGVNLDLSNINYNTNDANTFSFTVTNFCSYGEAISDSSRTVTIYEGYGDDCDPCKWHFPDYEANEFYLFTPNNDGVADYFPEAPNNEYNRIELSENAPLSQPTCEATIYRLAVYNRLGRELFTSEYDNHPWDGKLKNGKACKDGTYFYKIEYILNPYISDYDQDKPQVSTGTIYLDSGN